MACKSRTMGLASSSPIQIACLIVLASHHAASQGTLAANGSDAFYVASEPSASIVPQTLAAPIFPRIPGSFTNRARNAAIDWNVATQWVLREANMTNVGGRVFALQSAGVWKALQANSEASPPANSTAIVAYAAHLVLITMIPRYYAQYDELFRKQTLGLTQEELTYAEGIANPAVRDWLASRMLDGTQSIGRVIPATAPDGQFRNITSNANYRSFTQYAAAANNPMCLDANQTAEIIEQFPAAISYPSDQFNAEYTASYLLGGTTSRIRTASQTETTLFWADAGTGLVGHWNQVALSTLPTNSTVESTAKLMAMMNTAIYDSICTSYALKFKYNVWRPVNAIQAGDSDHPPDPSWNSLLPTPNNPSYPSSMSGLAGVAERVFQSFYETDSFLFTVGSEYGVGQSNTTLNPRLYTSFSDAAKEVVESRYLGGIEFKVDSSAGRSLGQQVAELCLAQFEDI